MREEAFRLLQRRTVAAVPVGRDRDEVGPAHREDAAGFREADVLAQQHPDAADRGVEDG